MNTTPCKGCGRPMVWAVLANGRRIPLDPAAPTYALTGIRDEATGLPVAERCTPSVMTTHFKTCAKASEF